MALSKTEKTSQITKSISVDDDAPSNAVTIDSGGSVGIGATPNAGIDTSAFPAALALGDQGILLGNATSTQIGVNFYWDGSDFKYLGSGKASRMYQQAGNIVFENTDTSGSENGSLSLTERVRIDSSGSLLVGNTTGASADGGHIFISNGMAFHARDGGVSLVVDRQTTDGDIVEFRKDGSTVGSIGTSNTVAYIMLYPSTGLRGGGSSIVPATTGGATTDNTKDLGASSIRWDDIYATNGTIQTSDENEKQDIEALSEAEQRVAVACKGLLRKFRWKSAVEEKGDDARIHFGIIAQDLQAAFEAEGLDAHRYAMFISSTWTDEETGEEKTRLGVRYSELLAFIISAI